MRLAHPKRIFAGTITLLLLTYGPAHPQIGLSTREFSYGAPDPGADGDVHSFSPDLLRIAYSAHADGKQYMVVDGVAGKRYDHLASVPAVFSPDGKHYAYSVHHGAKWHVVKDGIDKDDYDGIGQMVFSPDSRHFGYVAARGTRRLIVLDDVPGKEYQNLDSPVFSPSGKKFAFRATTPSGMVAVVNGFESRPYSGIGNGFLLFDSQDRLFMGVQVGSQWVVLTNGKPGPLYDAIGGKPPAQLRDGTGLLYAAKRGGKFLVVAGSKEQKPFDLLYMDTLRAGVGGRIAYIAVSQNRPVVVDDGNERVFKDVAPETFQISPDGRRLAYAANDGDGWFMVVDGVRSEKHANVGQPTFSPDSKRFAYFSGYDTPRGRRFIPVVDGLKGQEYTLIEAMTFIRPDLLRFSTVRNGMFIRVDITLR